LSRVRQVKMPAMTGALPVQDEPGLGAPLGGFVGHGVRHPFGQVAVGRGADVPPGQGVLAQAAPGLLFDLQPEPLRHSLLDPPHQDGGGVGAGDVNVLVAGEQRDPGQGELLFQLEGVVGVAAGAVDALADHRGEPGRWGRGFGEQVSEPAVTRDADAGELLVRAAVATLIGGQAAGFDVPEPHRDVPAGRQLGLALADLLAHRGNRVLEGEGGGAAAERDRHRLGWPGAHRRRWCWHAHVSSSLIAAFWRASYPAAAGPVMTRTFHRTFSPPGVLLSSILYV
jgi:hypothetical protein